MPERDLFHDVVKQSLIEEGWTITHDPLFISFGGVPMYVDLGAEKIIAAEREGKKIAVEIKSFMSSSLLYEFHTALGQYLDYRVALDEQETKRDLYLAVPLDAYEAFFLLPFTQEVMRRYNLKLIIYDTDKEVIVKWQE
jgi:hypothetical protein